MEAAAAGAGRLPGARLAADREGLPLLRHRPDRLGHAVRGGPRLRVATGQAARSSTASRPTRLRTLLVGGEDYLTLYGGEAVHRDGEVIGRVRSAAYGFTVERNVALAKLPAELAGGAEVQVDVLGELVPAVVAADALYDPGQRARSRS